MHLKNNIKARGSHLPLLLKMASITTGDILELGAGFGSTSFLHWYCFPEKRNLVTYEDNREFYEIMKQYESDFHKVVFVEDWDKIPIEKPWDLVLVDHFNSRRAVEAKRLANYAKFVVLHDTDERDEGKYHYSSVYPLYKYCYQFNLAWPRTAVVSNFVDVTKLGLW